LRIVLNAATGAYEKQKFKIHTGKFYTGRRQDCKILVQNTIYDLNLNGIYTLVTKNHSESCPKYSLRKIYRHLKAEIGSLRKDPQKLILIQNSIVYYDGI
jgi:hypothetical protein